MIVKIQRITEIVPHPNADRLELARLGAWETCVKKDTFQVDDLVVFIPPDAILPKLLHECLGITQYCGELPKNSEEAKQGKRRVRAARLRGVKSFGTLMTLSDLCEYLDSQGKYTTRDDVVAGARTYIQGEVEGFDCADLLGITKYVPPEKVTAGDQETNHILFHRYTDIERFQNFPSVIEEGEPVVITEKIHGTNARIGLVKDNEELVWMAGSHRTRRKQYDAQGRLSLYWEPLQQANVREMIEDLQHDKCAVAVIVFGEIYGPGIQDMQYGGKCEFRVFDISVNGEYMDWDDVKYLCGIYGVETVPVLYRGGFSVHKLMEVTDGPTTVCEEVVSKFKGREGCVVKPLTERPDFDLPTSRVILKSVSADYLARKGATDNA